MRRGGQVSTAFQIRPAERKRLKARIGISGPSGSGKTYGGLLIQRGLCGPEGRIAVLDTEQESSSMYSGLPALVTEAQPTGFDVLALDPPYSPQRYTQAVDAIEAAGYDGLLVDQISHAWAGPGGVLEFVDKAKNFNGTKQGFNAWKDATPMQWAFVERLLRFKGHLVVTMRQKVEWVVEKDEKGKSAPKKIGLSPIQREGIEYEFQIMLDLTNEGNLASVSKDRTGQVYGTVFQPTVEVGAKIAAFLASGKLEEPKPAETVQLPPDNHDDWRDPIKLAMECMRLCGKDKEASKSLFKELTGLESTAGMDAIKTLNGWAKLRVHPKYGTGGTK
jgi:hypothetical protein